jgi:hypothetical protein
VQESAPSVAQVWKDGHASKGHQPRRQGGAVAKVKYMNAARVKGYASYMTKDKEESHDASKAAENVSRYMESHGGEKGGRAELFTRAGQSVDLERFLADSRKEPRAWTIIVSPQHGEQLHMEGFTRSFIAQVEKDTGVSLDYIAAIHRNTPHTHVHILIRGRDLTGNEFRFDPQYISKACVPELTRSKPAPKRSG